VHGPCECTRWAGAAAKHRKLQTKKYALVLVTQKAESGISKLRVELTVAAMAHGERVDRDGVFAEKASEGNGRPVALISKQLIGEPVDHE